MINDFMNAYLHKIISWDDEKRKKRWGELLFTINGIGADTKEREE